MSKRPDEPLQVGRAAFAKAFFADWVTEHSKTILTLFFTLIMMTFALFQLTGKWTKHRQSDYLEIQKAFNLWSAQETLDLDTFKGLEKPLSRHPELQTKFGNAIAQRLLKLGDVSKADQYISASLRRTKELTSPYYSRFTANTLAISYGKFDEALAEAKQLKKDLEQDDAFWESRDKNLKSGAILYAYNLLRIAALERQVGNKEGELHAWEELVQNAGWKGLPKNFKIYDPEAYSLLANNFKQGDISLLDFIDARTKELASH